MELGTKLIVIFSLFLVGCSTGHCIKNNKKSSDHITRIKREYSASKTPQEPKVDETRLLVFKYDNSKQCKMGKPISLSKMKAELSGVHIFSEKKKNDGLIHLQVCGGVTGTANVFEIKKSDLSKALERGFKPWRFN